MGSVTLHCFLERAKRIAEAAGGAIVGFPTGVGAIEATTEVSPLTQADRASHEAITYRSLSENQEEASRWSVTQASLPAFC